MQYSHSITLVELSLLRQDKSNIVNWLTMLNIFWFTSFNDSFGFESPMVSQGWDSQYLPDASFKSKSVLPCLQLEDIKKMSFRS